MNAPLAAATVFPMMRVGLTPAQLVTIALTRIERRSVACFITRHFYLIGYPVLLQRERYFVRLASAVLKEFERG
jgi:hypothetical protein